MNDRLACSVSPLPPATTRGASVCDHHHATEGGLLLMGSIWEAVLGTGPVGPDDDFFTLGGDSLAAIEVLGEVHKWFGRRLPPAALSTAPTCRALAALALTGADPAASPLRYFGQEVRLERERLGMSRAELGKEAHCGYSLVAKIEAVTVESARAAGRALIGRSRPAVAVLGPGRGLEKAAVIADSLGRRAD